MSEFLVSDDGVLTEAVARDLAAFYKTKYPELDQLAFEAHVMVVRAYGALKIDAPFESRGGLTKARYNVLRLLYQSEHGRLPMSDIVQGMQVSPTNITKLVDGLEVDGFARRVEDPEDKRRLQVELLPKGRVVLEETFPLVGQHVNGLWQSMTREEKKTLINLLSKLRLHILTWTGSVEAPKKDAPLSAISN